MLIYDEAKIVGFIHIINRDYAHWVYHSCTLQTQPQTLRGQ